MILSDDEKSFIREQCKDEDGYNAVIAIFDQKLNSLEYNNWNNRFANLFSESMDAFVIFNDDLEFIDSNPAASDLFGYTRRELIDRTWNDVLFDDGTVDFNAMEQEWMQSILMRGEIKIQRKNGDPRTIQYVSMRDIRPNQHVSIMKDLTAEQWLQSQLVKTIDSLLQSQALAHLGTWEVDLNTRKVTWSDETYQICGLDKHSTTLSIEFGLSVFHPDDVTRARDTFRKSVTDKEPFHIEVRIVRPNGEVRWVIVQGAFQEDAITKVSTLNGTFLDITQRKLAEIELQASRELYQSLVNTIPLNVFRTDLDGKLIFVNRFLLDSLNTTEDQLIGKTGYDFYPEEDAIKYELDNMRVIKTGEPLHVIEENVSPTTGEKNYVETHKMPIYNSDGQIEGIQGIYWDITERKRAEDALRQSEIRANALLEAIPDLMFHISRDGVYLDCVADESKLIRGPLVEVIGANVRDFFPTPVTDLIMQKIQETLEKDQLISFEYPIDIPKLGLVDYECRMFKINDEEVYAIVRDITERNVALQRQLDFELEKERGKILTEFIRGASHEFRTPLATINTNLYLLANSENPDYAGKKIDQIGNQVQRLTRLVDTQLMIVRLNDASQLNTQAVDLHYVLDVLHHDALETYGEQPTLTIDVPQDLPMLLGDGAYLRTALEQILDNAYRFTPPDGHIKLTASPSDHSIVIHIVDTGSGIAQQSLPHVFKMFWREDQARSTPGFGLGLAVAKKIIDLHLGKIMIQSEPEKGTDVMITLPTQVQ